MKNASTRMTRALWVVDIMMIAVQPISGKSKFQLLPKMSTDRLFSSFSTMHYPLALAVNKSPAVYIYFITHARLAWVSGLPKGLGERRFLIRFHLSPFPPETPDTQANTRRTKVRTRPAGRFSDFGNFFIVFIKTPYSLPYIWHRSIFFWLNTRCIMLNSLHEKVL